MRVSVPVLSVQITPTEPIASIAGRRRTMALRRAIACTPIASVIVITAGSGVPSDAVDVSTSSLFGLDPIEVARIQQFKVALIHLGNVRNHIIYKARLILRNVDLPAVICCQAPVDFEDFARIGCKTRLVMPRDEDVATKGTIMEIVTGVVRGTTVSQVKLDEIVAKVKRTMP